MSLFFVFLGSVAALSFLPLFTKAKKDIPHVVISQISITGGSGKSSDDFIELYNPTEECLDLSGWQLRKKTSSGSESSIKVFDDDTTIAPHRYLLWANKDGAYASEARITSSATIAANNSVALYTGSESKDGKHADSVAWGEGKEFTEDTETFEENPEANESLERDKEDLSWKENFQEASPKNDDACTLPVKTYPSEIPVRLNEILANPEDKEADGEFIELYNAGAETFDLAGYILRDATASGKYVFPDETLLPPGTFLTLTRETFRFSLNNSSEEVTLRDPNNEVLQKVSIAKTKEGISLNFNTQKWRGAIPTPGQPNENDPLPKTKEKVPKKGYQDMYTFFDARGSDKNDKKLKYTWDFGDGHKSYLEETKHRYEKNGSYTVTLTVSDGKNDTVETFSLEIVSFPRYDVQIVAFAPNPAGKDTENEWVEIVNKEKKSLDLLGWSISTGAEKTTNHPVRKNLFLEPHAPLRLTRKEAAFSFPNTGGLIELKDPTGRVVQEIQYQPSEKTLIEGSWYSLNQKGEWTAHLPTDTPPSKRPLHSFDTSISLDEEEQKMLQQGKLHQTTQDTMTNLLTFQASSHLPETKRALLQAPPISQEAKIHPQSTPNQLMSKLVNILLLSLE